MIRRLWSDPLFRHGFLLMVTAQVGNLASVVFQMVAMRWLPDAQYGDLAAMLSVLIVFTTPWDAVRAATAHRIAIMVQTGGTGAIRRLLERWLLFVLVVGVGVLAVALVARDPLARYLQLGDPRLVPVSAAMLTFGLLILPVILGGFQGLQHFGALAWVGQMPAVLRLTFAAPVVIWLSATAAAALSAQLAATVLSVAAGGWAMWRAVQRHASAPAESTDSGGAYFVAAAFVLASFSLLVVTDVLLAKRYFDPAVAGRYAQAATIARAVFFLPLPIASVLFPKAASEGELRPEARAMVWRAMLYTAALLAVMSLFTLLFLGLIWRFFTGQAPRPEQEVWVVRLVVAMVPLAFTFLLVNFAMARKSFGPLYALPLCAAAYAGCAAWRHREPLDLIHALLLGGVLAVILSAWAAFRNPRPSAPPAV